MEYEALRDLQPQEFFKWFLEICKIPHGSFNEKQITEFLIKFAEERNIKYVVDKKGNIFMNIPPSKGYEDQPAILFQAHTDMVCVKDDDVEFDFKKDSIKLKIDGDKLMADRTTLGADNGVGVATMLAIADNTDILHPELEFLFTVEEEPGLIGIREFDMSLIKARRMINMDCGDSHVLAISSLGTHSGFVNGKFKLYDTNKECIALKLSIFGGLGGHAGIMARKGRACAGHNMGILLSCIEEFSPCLCSMESSGAISKTSDAVIVVKAELVQKVKEALYKKFKGIKSIYDRTDPDIDFAVEETEIPEKCLSERDTQNVANLLYTIRPGLNREDGFNNSKTITLTIFGSLKLENGIFEGVYTVRSSNDTDNDNVYYYYKKMAELFGFTITHRDSYSGWCEAKNSPFRDKCVATHNKLFGYDPEFEAVQGGIETAIIKGAIPDMDAVGFAPTARGAHTSHEYILLPETPDYWKWMLELLKEKE